MTRDIWTHYNENYFISLSYSYTDKDISSLQIAEVVLLRPEAQESEMLYDEDLPHIKSSQC